MIEFKNSKERCKTIGCFVGEVVTIYDEVNRLVSLDDWIRSWSKLALLEIEWFYYCPICGREVEKEITDFLAEKGIT